jgi:hypothetical protein
MAYALLYEMQSGSQKRGANQIETEHEYVDGYPRIPLRNQDTHVYYSDMTVLPTFIHF